MEPVQDLSDTRVLIPRLRRAIDGPTALSSGAISATLSDESLNAMAADSIASVIFYSNSLFGRKLEVAARDPIYMAPTAWKTDQPLEEADITAITAQAALDYFVGLISESKTAETISDEASSWSWEKSPQAFVERIRSLMKDRDSAIEVLEARGDAVDVSWVSFIGERDELTARVVEPYVKGEGPLYNDPRFEREAGFFGESEVL